MSEHKKPKIEDEIINKLSSEMQKNALDFVAYMRAAEMTNHTDMSNAFLYNDKWVCILIIDNGGNDNV